MTQAELLYGVEVSPRRAQDAAALAAFLPYVGALEFTDDAALHHAEIRTDLKTRGALIGANDLFIARARARARLGGAWGRISSGARGATSPRKGPCPPPTRPKDTNLLSA